MYNNGKMRFGLCCIFRKEPIHFRQITAKTLQKLPRSEQLLRLSDICLQNVKSLYKSLQFVSEKGIGAFRVLSPLFPRYTHPDVGYQLTDLPEKAEIRYFFEKIRKIRDLHDLRLSFHPDQFNVLSSPRKEVILNTIRELEYQAMLAEEVGAEIINLHAGGTYGHKKNALKRLEKNIKDLPISIRSRLTLENDDVSWTPADLLPFCESYYIPMVYDVHHHRCLPDGLSETEVTRKVVKLCEKLGKEPLFHISSPKNGWHNGSPKPHADYIDPADFPECWKGLTATVEVEAKSKELAVLKLMKDLGS